MSNAGEPPDLANADLDLRNLVATAIEMGASDVHVESDQKSQVRLRGHMFVINGLKTPTARSIKVAVAKVAPGPMDTGMGDLTDFIFVVGGRTCRTTTWNELDGKVGVVIRIIPNSDDVKLSPSGGTGSGKTTALYKACIAGRLAENVL